jgi:2-polyprenyl-3-methyl-5-hydroxy-6-metoxy-1,4-benzoquinol methylase
MPANSTTYTTCALCGSFVGNVLNLAASPPANELDTIYDPHKELFPLNLMQCVKCQHLQLDTEISPFRLFKHYTFTSNTSASNLAYFHSYADQMINKFNPKFVIDIGSNDGTFLHFFKDKGIKILGVDPAENIVKIANKNNVNTKCAFFNELIATEIKTKEGKADLITCNNMFAHNRNLDEVALGVKQLLSDNGTFIFEVSYSLEMLKNNLVDLIYHEHYHFWTIQSAMIYMRKFDLNVYDIQLVPETHGGSVRFYVQHYSLDNQIFDCNDKLDNMLTYEKNNLTNLVRDFYHDVEKNKTAIKMLLKDLKAKGKQVSILGYPAKACTLSYYYDLNQDVITNVYDDNPLKIDKYSHKGFKIQPAKFINTHKPDYLLILSWNYKDELMKRFELFHKTGGKFIIPFPNVEII